MPDDDDPFRDGPVPLMAEDIPGVVDAFFSSMPKPDRSPPFNESVYGKPTAAEVSKKYWEEQRQAIQDANEKHWARIFPDYRKEPEDA